MTTLFLGHLAGDFLLQNRWMAMTNYQNTKIGWIAATVHCIIYTLSVCLFMWNFDWYWIIVVFFSHFFIDKFMLAEKYMHYIKGKGMKDYVDKDTWINDLNYIPKPNKNINRYDILECHHATQLNLYQYVHLNDESILIGHQSVLLIYY